MTSKWPFVPISDVCDIRNGGTPDTKNELCWDGEHAWVTPAEMGKLQSPYLGETRRKLTDAGLASCTAQLLPPRSVILSSRAPIGHLVINEVPMATNQGCKGLIPSPAIDYKYLYYFLAASTDLLNELGSGTTFAELSMTKLKEVQIPLPPLDEQKRIVAKLDEAMGLSRDARTSIEEMQFQCSMILTRAIESSFSSKSEDWVEVQLSELMSIKHGFAFKSEHFESDGAEEILTPGHFYESGGFRPRPGKEKFYSGDYPEEFRLKPKTLLVAMTEQAPGLLASPLIVPDDRTYLHNQRLGLVEPKKPFDIDFAYWMFNHPSLRSQIAKSSTGAMVKHTSPTKIGEVLMRIPMDLNTQKEIAKKLGAVARHQQTLIEKSTQRVNQIDEFTKSVMSSAFAGEL